ncbi:MAG: aldehyde dehydrogenase family protein [Actinobacteria bacterium]|nr:aldehyde dehydrogenase family protein [Actinomycetota bacterium]
MKTLQNFINGKSVPSSSGQTQDLINPATGEVFAKAPVSNAADIDSAMKAAASAFEVWKESTPGERQKAINKIADAIESRSEELIPSDTTPVSTVWMAELMQEFLPEGVMNVVTGNRDTGRLLVDHEIPQFVSITGSVRAGMEVAEQASKDLKKVHLELGGKAPVVIFDDANLEAACEWIAVAGYFNAGQDCTAATRVIVEASAYEDVVNLLSEQAKNVIKVGMPDEDVLVGPVNNANQLARVQGFLDRVPAHARVTAGGSAIKRPGYFWNPTVVADLKQSDEMIQNEIFAPVITVQKFTDESEAVRYANGVKYGLASSVWTKDHGRAMRMAKAFDFGCVWINTHIPMVAEMPHGGFKHSGYGKDLSGYGFEEYTRIKHVMTNLNA